MKKLVGLLASIALIGASACANEPAGRGTTAQQQPAPAQEPATAQQEPGRALPEEGVGGAGEQRGFDDDADLDDGIGGAGDLDDDDVGIGGTGAAAGGGG